MTLESGFDFSGQTPTVKAAVDRGAYVLSEAGLDSPRADAKALVLHLLGVEQPWQAPPRLTEQQWMAYLELIGKRAHRIPLQHLTGWMYFRYLKLACRREVFVVRPETEWVAEAGIGFLKKHLGIGALVDPDVDYPPTLTIDLCTGSGAIALAVATEVPGSKVVGVEQSAEALDLARHNADLVRAANVEFAQADIFADDWWKSWQGRADLVISNPPYVPAGDVTQPEALQDPVAALYGGGDDGLEAPFRILELAKRLLRPGGAVVIEHAEVQAEAMREKANELGFTNIAIGNDLTGRPRYLQAEL